jgi:hypothetical protein
MTNRTYGPEIKAQVIAEFALTGNKSALARKYGVPRQTVITWLKETEPPLSAMTGSQKEDLGALVYEYLAAGLHALIAQARAMGDPEWFKGQGATAHQIHGTLADKLVIVFGGIERGTTGEDDDSG